MKMNFSNDELIKTVDLIKKQVSQGGEMVSKTMDVASSATICAIFSHSSMERTTGYEPVNWGSSPHVKTNILT